MQPPMVCQRSGLIMDSCIQGGSNLLSSMNDSSFFRLSKIFDLEKNNRLDWKPFRDGIDAVWLHKEVNGPAAALLKFKPKAGSLLSTL